MCFLAGAGCWALWALNHEYRQKAGCVLGLAGQHWIQFIFSLGSAGSASRGGLGCRGTAACGCLLWYTALLTLRKELAGLHEKLPSVIM